MSKKNPEKFQQKQITDKKMKRKKEIRKTGKTTYFYQYHVLFRSSVPTLESVRLWIFL